MNKQNVYMKLEGLLEMELHEIFSAENECRDTLDIDSCHHAAWLFDLELQMMDREGYTYNLNTPF